MESNVVRNSLL